jgi:hypothetical protein
MISNSIPRIVRSTRISFSPFSGVTSPTIQTQKPPKWSNSY